MDRESALLLALGLLLAAALVVCVSGWILFVRDRRAEHEEDDAAPELSSPMDR